MKPDMKRRYKILLIIVAIIVAVCAVCHFIADSIAEKELRTALSEIPDAKIEFKDLGFSLIGGDLRLRGLSIEKDSIKAGIDLIKLDGLSYKNLVNGEVSVKRLLIKGPSAKIVLTGEEAEKKVEVENDSVPAKPDASFIKKVLLSELCIENARVNLTSLKDSTKVSLKELDFNARDLGYLFEEGKPVYNDSCYSIELDSLDYIDPTGLSRIKISHLETSDGGPVKALAMRLYNCVGKEQVAERMGKVASMWYDVQLDSMYTSAINIPRMVESKRVDIDYVYMAGPEIVLFQDDRYPPAVPYPTMQEGLNQVKIPVHVKKVDAISKDFTFIWETTHINRGTFVMKNLRLGIKSASNAHNNLMEMSIKAGHKGRSRLDMDVFTKNDKQETTYGTMKIYDLEGSRLDSFLRPLFGATAKAEIHKIDCEFNGDKSSLKTDFCMEYSNLELQAWNDSTAPFKIVAENSGLINFLANLIVPKSNPAVPGNDPKEVEFTVKRDPWQPYPTYLIGNLTNGMMKTVLPGSAVHKTKK